MLGLVMRTTTALLSLYFWVNTGIHAAQTGSKCGISQVWDPTVSSLRVVGGTEAMYGSHPWLVSLQNRGSHFCGGSILSDCWIMTAAHCFTSLSKEFLSGVRVLVGEFDQRVHDEEEQVFLVKSVSVHEKYNPALPMNYDIALIELNQRIQMGARVQPICLPLPYDNILPQTACMTAGWGRIKERSMMNQRLVWPQPSMTVLCAGPETGGRDACQGDSGGPLVCPAGSEGHRWVALGVTSWGKGCGRSWGNNSSRPPSKRGSPGIFTDVRLLLPWIKRKLREAEHQQQTTVSSRLCSVRDGPVSDINGVIKNPRLHGDRYDNNQLCLWSISVPPGYSILLEFDLFDLENDSYCRYDRLTVSVGSHRPVGIFCGSVLPGPVLLNNSHNATLLFSSDVSRAGSGFVIRHHAVKGHSHPGCGTLVLVDDKASIHSPNHPQAYSNDCVLHWVIHAPLGHVVKLEFTDFDLEESERCLYDSLTVLGDVEGTEEIALLCGGSIPPPVLSYHSTMVLRFTSDSSIARRGFRATLTFISITDLQNQKRTDVADLPDVLTTFEPVVQQYRTRALPHRADVDHDASEDVTLNVDRSVDEDYSSESSELAQ
ncbi:ovochymase-2 isoform X4 [Simochromis diagramma]|uniref:ovochymase-2 isoform X4 n=1 Tax=Simochromis diagramma TaxID=43689 RepID=UPI001A7EDD4B|nr:ovochymase-2 isoform X4 [Simochromis diagramma]